jgi:Carboxypeptidase regulatory-like domain
MQVGTLVIAGMFGMVGLVAGRASAPAAPIVIAATPHVAPTVVVAPTRVVAHEVADDVVANDEPTDVTDDGGGGTDLAAVLANLHDQAASRPDRLAVLGQVTDPTGQPMAGCTVIVTGPNLDLAQTTITDEHGNYKVVGLPAGYYTVTFYYADQTVERTEIASREIEATQLDLSMDPNAHPTRPSYDEPSYEPSFEGGDDYRNIPVPGRVFESALGAAAGSQNDSTGYTISRGDDFTWNIPVPGRTFDSVLGAAAEGQNDPLGVSFSGGSSIENTYVIEE